MNFDCLYEYAGNPKKETPPAEALAALPNGEPKPPEVLRRKSRSEQVHREILPQPPAPTKWWQFWK